MPAAPGTLGLAAEAAFDADLARDRGHLVGEDRQRVGHVVDRVGERGDLALRLRPSSFCRRSPFATAVTTLTMPRTWLVRLAAIDVDVVGEVLPRAGDARHRGLTAELAFGADLARDARRLRPRSR